MAKVIYVDILDDDGKGTLAVRAASDPPTRMLPAGSAQACCRDRYPGTNEFMSQKKARSAW